MRMFSRQLVFTIAMLLAPAKLLGQGSDPKHIDALVQQSLQAWEVPGAALVLVHNEQIVWAKGYGTRTLGKNEPVTPDTIFPLASCSKSFTSAAIASLVQQKRLTWDDPVHKHLPDFRLHERAANEMVTIRDLLSHRTGVGGHDLLWFRAPWSQAESVRRIGRMPASGPFRASFFYQSIMYMAVGQIVAKNHNDGWAGFVREHLLQPLKMGQTTLTYAAAQNQKDHSSAHRRNAQDRIETCPWYVQNEPNAAGSVCLSANDLGKWLRFQLTGRSAEKLVLPIETLDETHKPHIVIPLAGFSKLLNPDSAQLSYAQGWLVQDYRGVKLVQHGGLIDGFRIHLALLPDQKIGIGVLSNLHDTRMPLALSNLLVDYLLRLPPKDWNAYFGALVQADAKAKQEADQQRDQHRDKLIKPSLPLAHYVGAYEHPAFGVCKVRAENGILHWEWSSYQKSLDHYRGDIFATKDVDLSDPLFEFVVRAGKCVGLRTLDVTFAKKEP